MQEIRVHPFFADIDWAKLLQRKLVPPWIPQEDEEEMSLIYFDKVFTRLPVNSDSSPQASPPASLGGLHFQGFSHSQSTFHRPSSTDSMFAQYGFKSFSEACNAEGDESMGGVVGHHEAGQNDTEGFTLGDMSL